jgi:Uncharacterized protein conserved in bacteria (DUF2344)
MGRAGPVPCPCHRLQHPLLHRSGRLADVTGPTDPAQSPPAEPRQRWRITFARDPVAPDQVGRSVLDAWQDCLAGSGLPIAGLDPAGSRARIAFAAPLPAAVRGDAELADLWLVERRPLWAVREALATRMPAAHRWIAGEDVWLGAPALAGRVVAADWQVELVGSEPDRDRLAAAALELVAARSLPRVRVKGGAEKRYDLRVLFASVALEPGGDPGGDPPAARRCRLAIRTRFHPELGSGRPEEVVAALGDVAGIPIEIGAINRVRLLLDDEPPARARR